MRCLHQRKVGVLAHVGFSFSRVSVMKRVFHSKLMKMPALHRNLSRQVNPLLLFMKIHAYPWEPPVTARVHLAIPQDLTH